VTISKHPIHWSWAREEVNSRSYVYTYSRYWRQRADERLVNPPQDNQEPLVAKDTTPGELGVSRSTECDTFPFTARL